MRVSVSGVGVPGQRLGVVNVDGVDPSGRLMSVAEIQRAFRYLCTSRLELALATAPPASGVHHTSDSLDELGHRAVVAAPELSPHMWDEPRYDASAASTHTSFNAAEATEIGGSRLGREWIVIIAAHAGAGASCTALAVADALSAAGRPCRLVETAAPTRSGLVAASNVELGFDASGAWRRGGRGQVTTYRRAHDSAPPGWPEQPISETVTTVVDAGLPSPGNLERIAESRPTVVVTCRSTIPGVRMVEHILVALGDAPAFVIAIGRSRWPGDVTASVGRRLRRLKDADRVVCMPIDRHLQVTGPTNSPLPKPVTTAGRTVLRLIDAARTGEIGTATRSASRGKATS